MVEGDLLVLDTASIVSTEFYYPGLRINDIPGIEDFNRAYADNKNLIQGFKAAMDSLNQQAFLEGYRSVAGEQMPEFVGDTKSTRFHLIIKSVHWKSSLDLSEPDVIRLEFILVDNPQRRLQQGRYYMKKVPGSITDSYEKTLSSAYFKAGAEFARALKDFEPSEEEDDSH